MATAILEKVIMTERQEHREDKPDMANQQKKPGDEQSSTDPTKTDTDLTPEQFYQKIVKRPEIRELLEDLANTKKEKGQDNKD